MCVCVEGKKEDLSSMMVCARTFIFRMKKPLLHYSVYVVRASPWHRRKTYYYVVLPPTKNGSPFGSDEAISGLMLVSATVRILTCLSWWVLWD